MSDPYVEHVRLFTQTGLTLGRILWHLLRAAQDVDAKDHIDEPSENAMAHRRIATAFGEEVGKDEIYWWVYKKEKNVEALKEKVRQTLAYVQLLKEHSAKLDSSDIDTYADLVSMLAKFLQSHQDEIRTLHEFVLWLSGSDPLAPVILFTYRVWGSTRRSDRWLDLEVPSIDVEMPQVIQALTEIACGLRRQFRYTRFYEAMDIGAEMYDSDPESYSSVNIPERRVVSRTANKVLSEFAVFFEELRDSLRNIELDIEKYLAERDLLKAESFWKSFINKARDPGRIESGLWDFKETLPMWCTAGNERLKAEIDFCKLIAAFANRDGGAIIIGITNDTRVIVGVADLENRVKSISKVIQRWLYCPKKDAIFHLQPVCFEHDTQVVNCLVIAVAQSANVVGVRGNSEEYYYPDRDQTGVTYLGRAQLETRKSHLKAGDNFGFMKDLQAFLRD